MSSEPNTSPTIDDLDVRLDLTDYRILHILQDDKLWKNKIHQQLEGHAADTVSVQTVGRRVDQLQDAGLLDTQILQPESIKRDFIIGFEITDLGEEALANAHVCTQGDCELLSGPDDDPHVHDFAPVSEYIATELTAGDPATTVDADGDADAEAELADAS